MAFFQPGFFSFLKLFYPQGSTQVPTASCNNNCNHVPRTFTCLILLNPFHSSLVSHLTACLFQPGVCPLLDAAAWTSLRAGSMVSHSCLSAPLPLSINLYIIHFILLQFVTVFLHVCILPFDPTVSFLKTGTLSYPPVRCSSTTCSM